MCSPHYRRAAVGGSRDLMGMGKIKVYSLKILSKLTWICANNGTIQTPLGYAGIQCLEEGPHADGHQGSEYTIERNIEDANLSCKGRKIKKQEEQPIRL